MQQITYYFELVIYHKISTKFDIFIYNTNNPNIEIGDLVEVPFGKKQVHAVVYKKIEHPQVSYEIKSIENIIFKQALNIQQVEIVSWLSSYFAVHTYKAIKLILPEYLYKKIKKTKIFERFLKNHLRDNDIKSTDKNNHHITKEIKLNKVQQDALNKIQQDIHAQYLLYGVSGSGKTFVYLSLIQNIIDSGYTAIIIIPEIFISHQVLQTYTDFFQDRCVVYHSELKDNEKLKIWYEVRQGKIPVIISTKIGLFLPIPNLKMVVVDEYHDFSYTNQTRPAYNIKQILDFMHHKYNINSIYSSATPNVSDIHKYKIVQIKEPFNKTVTINKINIEPINMNLNTSKTHISKKAMEEIQATIEKKQQVLIYHNQRGIAKSIFCNTCNYIYKCPNCDISLTYHKLKNTEYLLCHQCGYIQKITNTCPKCGGYDFKVFKYGIQYTEQILSKSFPDKHIIRLDRDNIKSYKVLEEFYNGITENKYDIIIGTNIITKGIVLKNIGLIVIVDIDNSFNYPSFDSQEKAMQTLYQLIGRAKNSIYSPKILLQTFQPQNTYLKYIMKQDYNLFLKDELERRKTYQYPPYSILINIHHKDKSKEKCIETLKEIQKAISDIKDIISCNLIPSIIPFSKNEHHWQLLIKTTHYTKYFMDILKQFKMVKISIYE